MTALLVVTALGLLGYAAISGRVAGTPLTAPIWFTTLGILIHFVLPGTGGLEQHGESVHVLAEITLVLVLFTDASRIDLRLLWREHDLPMRMLAIGLPLTIALGTGVAALLLPLGLWEAALVAAILAPTDAALGQAVVSDRAVPVRIRQTLNVESGLNDGIALPAVLVFLCIADASHQPGAEPGYWVRFTALQVTLGPLAGVVVGGLGGWLVRTATARGWMSRTFQELSALGIALLAFAGAELVGGNGFLAAFLGGLVLGNTTKGVCSYLVEFGDTEGQLLALLTFTAFGALLVPIAVARFDFVVLGYAVASLTLIRAVPVVLSLLGKGLRPPTFGFLAWFGPRGIASILFALLVAESSEQPFVEDVLAIVATTVLLSVFAHGLSAAPLARAYGRYAARSHTPDSAESRTVERMSLRHRRPHPSAPT